MFALGVMYNGGLLLELVVNQVLINLCSRV